MTARQPRFGEGFSHPVSTDRKARLAIVVTHPIQHFVGFYRALASHPALDVHVLFGMPLGVQSYFDVGMQTEIAWKMNLLEGYSSEFLEEVEPGRQSSLTKPNTPSLGGRLDAFAPDAVLIYGYAQMNALRAIAWCRRHKVPLMLISDSERAARNAPVREAIKRVTIPMIYRRVDAFLSVGDNNEAYYRYYGAPAGRIFRSPFTIDEAAFGNALGRRDIARAELRERLSLSPVSRVLLYVGKLYPGKRPADLVAAMASLKRAGRDQDLHVVVAGNGEQFEELRRTVEAEMLNVHLLGFINVDLLPDLYAAADALVVPSEVDRHPLVCSEAAYMNLPMIISDRVGSVGPTDIARPGENTLVYPCGDIAGLANAITALDTDADLRHRMGSRSREIYDTLDMSASVGGVLSALETVLGK